MSKISKTFPQKLSQQNWLHFSLVVAVTIFLALGVGELRISAETRVLAGPEDQMRQDLERFEGRFAQNNNLLFVMAPHNGAIFDDNNLAAIEALTELAWQLPFVSKVTSITNFPLIVSEEDSFGVSPLGLRQEQNLAVAEEQVRAEPWLYGLLLDTEAHVTGINVLFVIPSEATAEIAEIMSDVAETRETMARDYPAMDIHVTGNIALMNAFAESARRDVEWLIPLAFAVVLGIAFVFLQDWRLIATLGVYLGFCVFGAMGAAGWLSHFGWSGHVLNPATVAAPIIIMTLAMASIVHLLSGVQVALAQGATVDEAVNTAMDESRNAIILTVMTTAVGFLCMNFAASPPLRTLGNIVAMGLGIALAMALFVVPVVLRRLKIRAKDVPSRQLAAMIDWISHHKAFVLTLMLLLSGLAFTGIVKIRADDDFIRYFDDSFSYRSASDFTEDHLTGLNLLEFAFEAGEDHGINNPAYFQRLDEFAIWLRQQPGVEHVTTLSDKLRQINDVLRPEDAPGSLPQTRELTAQYLLLFELSLPPGSDIADRINATRSATRVTLVARHITSADLRALNLAAESWLAENNPIAGQSDGRSINYFFAALSLANIKSMIIGTGLALMMISVVVLIALQDVRLGIVSLVANLLPPAVGFGVWGFTVGEIGLASSVVAAMTFGIVVDDTIHLLLRFKKGRASGLSEYEAMRKAYVSVGRAMVITSLALAGGFALLMMSGFEINSSLGLFTSIIVVAALIIDLTLVPAMILATSKK